MSRRLVRTEVAVLLPEGKRAYKIRFNIRTAPAAGWDAYRQMIVADNQRDAETAVISMAREAGHEVRILDGERVDEPAPASK